MWHVLGVGVAITLSSQTAPILPRGPDGQHFLGAHSPQSLQRNTLVLEEKEQGRKPRALGSNSTTSWPPFPLSAHMRARWRGSLPRTRVES